MAAVQELKSTGLFSASPQVVSLLDVDQELADRVPAADHPAARLATRATVLRVAPGEWSADEPDPDGVGWYVVSGLVGRRVRVGRRESLELLAPGDVLRPGGEEEPALVTCDVRWQALGRVTLAHLSGRFCHAIAPWPGLSTGLADRAMRRARWLAVQAAVTAHPTIEERLLLTLAHLGERMGRVTPEGVLLDVPLSHRLLAQCVQALRPSVTAGLLRLRDSDRLLQPRRGRWLITQAGLDDVARFCGREVVPC